MSQIDLGQAASDFAQEVQDLLDAVLPGTRQVKVVQFKDRYVVRPEGAGLEPEMIPVLVHGDPLARLRLSVGCRLDHRYTYLAVERSDFHLLAEPPHREPLVRLEFRRDARRVPAAHWQVHAERGLFSVLLARTGVKAPHDLATLHVPVGGARMRPCLEDFLEFLVRECGVDSNHGWEAAVEAGRERWRRRQLAALVRDAPDEVVRVLRENGYSVVPPASGDLPGQSEMLRAW